MSDIVDKSKENDFVSPAGGRDGLHKNGNKLVAPKNRIKSPAGARVIIDRMRSNHIKRCEGFERIKGMLDGNPPYNPKRIRASGLSDLTNVNWKDGKAIFQGIALAYWSLFNEVENILEFQVRLSNDQGQNALWGQILS